MATIEKTRITVEEFQALPETTTPTELIDGELIVSPSPLDPHQETSWSMVGYLAGLKLRGSFRHAPTDVHIGGNNVVQPDIFWVREDSTECIQQHQRWYGAPDLVVEILSPSTAHRDKGKKYDIYEQYGVREYWLVDPEALYLEVYQRDGEKFMRRGVFGMGEMFESAVLGRTIEITALLGKTV